MRKSLLVIAFGLLSAQAALAGDSTKTAVGRQADVMTMR